MDIWTVARVLNTLAVFNGEDIELIPRIMPTRGLRIAVRIDGVHRGHLDHPARQCAAAIRALGTGTYQPA